MPCCIDRMRFSPRFSIRKKITFTSYSFFFSFFLPSPGPLCFRFRPGEFVLEFYHVIFCVPGPYISGRVFVWFGFCRRDGTPAGGSSAVEQRTVKCVTAQRSFGREFKSPSPDFFRSPGDFFYFQTGVVIFYRDIVIRSYHGESTASHPNCEVKHRWARSVLW